MHAYNAKIQYMKEIPKSVELSKQAVLALTSSQVNVFHTVNFEKKIIIVNNLKT